MYKLMVLFLIFGKNISEKEMVKSVELSYQTRGTQKYLHISNDSILVEINGRISNYKTTPAQWKKILKSLEKVKLSGISTLKRPSTKSYYDGALITQMKVITNIKEYESVSFDHDNPPTILVKTINAMKYTLSKTENKNDF
jgi:hypothetical protein